MCYINKLKVYFGNFFGFGDRIWSNLETPNLTVILNWLFLLSIFLISISPQVLSASNKIFSTRSFVLFYVNPMWSET